MNAPVSEASVPGQTLISAAAKALAKAPDRQAVEFEGRWFTYGELKHIADELVALIRGTGADPRAPVAFAPRNRPSAIAAMIALIGEGRTIRMMYAYQSGAALAQTFEQIKASILVAAIEDFSPEVVAKLRELGCAGIGLSEKGAEIVAGLETVTRPTDPDAPKVPTFEMLTSGTTGPAKLWPLTYELLEGRFVHGNSVFADEEQLKAPPMLICYPMCNISGLYSVVPAMFVGLPIVLQSKFTLEDWLDYVKRYRPPEIFLPPVGVQMLLDAEIPPEALGEAKLCRSGMTNLPLELHKAFEERYGMPILLAYGATEFGGVVVQMSMDDVAKWGSAKRGSTGRAFGEAKVRVVDPDSGEVLPAGEGGLLEVLVPSIRPDWVRTSDMAKIDEDDFVYILGRADGAIMRGGFKILPETIENALAKHPDIEGAAAVGLEDRRLGQVPVALIQMKPGVPEPSPKELEQFIRRHVPATAVPTRWYFVDAIPRTASLKIARKEVKELLAKLVG